jgi:N-acetylglucosaminyl-diphospho-decaprenol L-rhamnosyltransferase
MMLSIITVAHGAKEHLARCLQSVADASPLDGDYEQIVIDNASPDGAADMVEQVFPHVILLRNGENIGFARAANMGLLKANGDPILLLNPDCILPRNAAEELIRFLNSRPRVGAASPMLVTPAGTPQISYARFPRLFAHLLGLSPFGWVLPSPLKDCGFSGVPPSLDEQVPRPADAPAGSCLLVRRAAYEETGGLDERFFMYYEDIEWAFRMARKRWERYYVPAVRVVHDMGATWARAPTGLQLARSYQGKYRYFEITHSPMAGKLVRGTTVACARLNVLLGGILSGLGIGGDSWVRKREFNQRLLKVHRDFLTDGTS